MRLEIYCLVLLIVSVGLLNGADDPLKNRCGSDLKNVMPCLSFATGKAETPGKECCDSAASIDQSDRAVCFCYIIEQVHSGSSNNSAIKSFGIQEGRLLKLPSACKINDVNVTTCPKLLNLPANSPDAAFFTNASASTSATTTAVAAGPSDSNAFKHSPQLLAGHLPVAVAIFSFTFWKML